MKNLLLVGVLVIAGLVTCGWYGPSLLLEARATEAWPSVPGTVVEARPVSQGSGGKRSHGVAIDYRYSFKESEYTGDRYAVGTPHLPAQSSAHAAQLAGGIPPGGPSRSSWIPRIRIPRCWSGEAPARPG